MQHALRPYVTTAIAVAGASLIAITPVTPTPPGVQVRAVSLASSDDILAPYENLYTSTLGNMQSVSQDWLDHPFPILGQIATNWTGYIEQVMADPASITSIPGEIGTHLQSLLSTVLSGVGAEFLPLPAQVSVDSALLAVLVGVLGPLVTTFNEIGTIIGQITTASDPTAVFTALADAPANLLNAFLNGQASIDGIPFDGILVSAGQTVDADVTFGDLVNGLGSLLNGAGGVLSALGANLDLGGLFNQLFDAPLSTLLDDLGQGNLSVGGLLSDLPSVGNVTLGNLLNLSTGTTQTLGGETVGDLLNLSTGPGGQTLGGSTLGTLLNLATGSGGQTLGGSTLADLLNLSTGTGGQTLGGLTLGDLLNLSTGTGGQTLGGSTLGDLLNLSTGPGGQTLGGETLASLLGLATGSGGQTLGGETLGNLLGLATGPGQTLGGSTLGDLLNLATGPGGQTLGGETLGSLLNLATGPAGQTLGGDTLGDLLNLATGPGQTLGGLTLGETTAGTQGGLLDALGLGGMSLGEATLGTHGGLLDALGLGGTSLETLVTNLGLGGITLGEQSAILPEYSTMSVASLLNLLQDPDPEQTFIQEFSPLLPGMTVTFSPEDSVDTNSDAITGVSAGTTLSLADLQNDLGLGSETTAEFASYLAASYPDMSIVTPEDMVDTGNILFCYPASCGDGFPPSDEVVIPENTTMSVAALQQDLGDQETLEQFEGYLLNTYELGGASLTVDIAGSPADTVNPDYSMYGGIFNNGIPDVSSLNVGELQADMAGPDPAISSFTASQFEAFLAENYPDMTVTHAPLEDTGPYAIDSVAAGTTLSLGSLQNDLGLGGETPIEFVTNLINYYDIGPSFDGPGMTITLSPDEDIVDTGPNALGYFVPGSGLLDDLGLGNVSLLSLLNELGVNPSAGADVGSQTVDQLLQAAGIAGEPVGTLLDHTTPLGLGTLLQTLDNIDGVTAGSGVSGSFDALIYAAVNIAAPTLNDVNIDSLFSGVTLQQLVDTFEFGGVTVDQLLSGDNQTLDGLVSGLGLSTLSVSSLLSELGFGNDSLDQLLSNVGLGGTSLDQLLSNVGLNSMSLDTLVTNLGLNTTSLDALLGDLGLTNVSLDTLLGDLGLSNTSLDGLLGDLGLTNVSLDGLLGDLGLSNVSLDGLLGGLGLNSVGLDGLLGALGLSNVSLDGLLGVLGLGNVSLNGLLGVLGLGNVSLDGLLGGLGLGNVSLDGLLGDLGLNSVSLDTLLGGLNLSGVNLDSLLGDLGVGNLSLGGLLSDLGLDNMDVANLDVGPLEGLAPALSDYLAEIAQALGA